MFVGIDVSKATLDVAILDAGQTRSSRVANTPDAITALASELAAVTPTLVGPDKVQLVIDDGNATAADICTDAVAAACEQYGVK